MKKILSLVVVVIAAVGQVYATGTEPHSPVGISVIKKGVIVKLFYRGEQSGKVKVAIYDGKGRMVFHETMKNTEHFMRPYNFSSLPAGEYTIELSDEQGKRVQKISHRAAEPIRAARLTRLNGDENKYMLAVPNKGKESLTVKIFDDSNNKLYEETEVIEGNFAKLYNLNEIQGQPVFHIVDEAGRMIRLTKSNQ